jgi:enoyl-CoA hydratase
MDVVSLSFDDLRSMVATGTVDEELGVAVGAPVAVVSASDVEPHDVEAIASTITSLPCVVLAAPGSGPMIAGAVDALPDHESLERILDQVTRAPLASAALVLLLRGGDHRTIDEGLVAESTTYSMLQSGPEFAAWRESRPRKERRDPAPVLLVDREGLTLHLILNRPHVHNAWSRDLRDAMADALHVAIADDTISRIDIRGNGPSFCSGGDLDEFGLFPDPATAHTIRLSRSPARLLARVSDRVISHLHGACMGAGIELPAFGQTIVAARTTSIALPELALGLVPGAGGTVSLPRRIGRHRTALLALTAAPIDAQTALEWGLVDALD